MKIKQFETTAIGTAIAYTALADDGHLYTRMRDRCDGKWVRLPDLCAENIDERHSAPARKQKRYIKTPADNKHAKFVAPSVEEVDAYCKERQNGLSGRDFVDHYAMKGWRVGNVTMRDWKAAVRTWENRRNASDVQEAEQAEKRKKSGVRVFTGVCDCGKSAFLKRPGDTEDVAISATCSECGKKFKATVMK